MPCSRLVGALMIDWPSSLRWLHPEAVARSPAGPSALLPEHLGLQALGLFLQDRGDRIVDRGGDDADTERHDQRRRDELPGRHAGGARTTSSSRRDRPRKQDIAPISTQNGRMRSVDLRHAKQRNLRDEQRGDFGTSPGAPHHLDVVDQGHQREDAKQHRDQRA